MRSDEQDAVERYLIEQGWEPHHARIVTERPRTLMYATARFNMWLRDLANAITSAFTKQ